MMGFKQLNIRTTREMLLLFYFLLSVLSKQLSQPLLQHNCQRAMTAAVHHQQKLLKHFQPVNSANTQHVCKPEWTSSQCCSTYNKEMAPEIAFKPNGHLLVDERLQIKIDKLESNQKVTVYAYLKEEKKTFEACGCFIADKQGTVNLGRQASTSGTYTGNSPFNNPINTYNLYW